MSIRIKVILPYLLLTLVVAVTGAYVVTRLVSTSLSERLNNQLFEAGRVVSDSFARQERQQIDASLNVIYTRGVAEALVDADRAELASIVTPTAKANTLENLLIVNMQGQEMLHLHEQDSGGILNVTQAGQTINLEIVQMLITARDPNAPPARAIKKDPANNRWYYFTALPFTFNNEMLGVIVVGTSIDTLMPYLKSTSLADVMIYNEDGKALGSTLQAEGEDKELYLQTLSMEPGLYQEVLTGEDLVVGKNLSLGERNYALAYGKLQVGNDTLGNFAVALSSDYVADTGVTNRNLYVLIFSAAMILVIGLGYFISRLIINPISSLVQTSLAITGGDLNKRSGIQAKDEIGTLATTFDEMTERLQKHTIELERTNRILEQMDKTKSSFIQISAHELRTPLTLIQGYTNMLQQRKDKDAEMELLTNGLADGLDRILEVVNSMLDVSKIDSQTLNMAPTHIQIKLVIARAQQPFLSAYQERKLQVITEGLDDLPVLLADPDLLRKVFYQVMMNAIKYTPDGGKITISGRVVENKPAPSEIEIAIRDTGIGISPQYQELVFEKFYQTGEVQLHSSGKTKFKGGGPGLGLAIARGIINAHGGRIWLESPGHDEETCPGTTVYIRLPLESAIDD